MNFEKLTLEESLEIIPSLSVEQLKNFINRVTSLAEIRDSGNVDIYELWGENVDSNLMLVDEVLPWAYIEAGKRAGGAYG